MTYKKRFWITAILIALLAYLFWTGSRYPALDEKAMMSGAIQLEDALSFEAKFPITADMGLVERIFWSTLNWVNTNKKGMTFGILFAAAFLTMTAYLKRKSFRSGFSNSVLGMAIGTPLGVCVNCAAPIARGMYSGGLRVETTLSAMIASPTLNVVVLTMAFSLLPLYMALTKIALSLVVILIVVPLIARSLPQKTIEVPASTPWSDAELTQDTVTTESLLTAAVAVALSFGRNLWYIVKMTVPLMLLAGFLGTVAATLLPGDLILGLKFNIALLVLIALVGLFLPVPIAFDVVVTGALLGSGLEQGYVMALLFTLGSFSVYSFFIVAQAVSMRVASQLALAVLILGILGGIGAQSYHNWQSQRALEILLSDNKPTAQFWAAMADEAPAPLEITAIPFAPLSPAAETPFTRLEADQVGIDKPLEFSLRDMWPPFWEGRSVSTGDIDRDGDLDLVIASTEAGLYLYENDGHGQFARMATNIGPLADMEVFNAALADMDNDGWPDLFIATYRQGNYLLKNVAGDLGTLPPQPIANRDDAVLSIALSFADADRDGDLDVALGNWAAGWYRRVPGEESRNRIVWNSPPLGDDFTDLPGIPGETLSILFSDINSDGATDLLVGNDFEIPDVYYHGDGAGGLRMITHQDGLIPHTTTTTMAIKTGDLMNDGVPEIYLAQIAGRSSGVSKKLKMQPLEKYCGTIQNLDARAACDANMAIKTWYKSGNNFDPSYAGRCQELSGALQGECKAMLVKDLAIQRDDPGICKLIPATQTRARSFCDLHFQPIRQITAKEAKASYPQVLRANILLEHSEKDGAYEDTATPRGLEVGGWSWDTKFGDFDNDGWLDVYIVNGTWVPNEVSPSNLFFHNQGNGSFVEASGPFGLEDYLMTAAATAFDIDNDGDLDLISHPVNGPVTLFRNSTQTGAAIAFELDDRRGNRDGIGALISITDNLGRTQSREIQLGGGFMSFDAPRVHFGLGSAQGVVTGTIRWADGDVSDLPLPLDAGALYRIKRRP